MESRSDSFFNSFQFLFKLFFLNLGNLILTQNKKFKIKIKTDTNFFFQLFVLKRYKKSECGWKVMVSGGKEIITDIFDNNNGIYECHFTIRNVGSYQLTVFFRDIEIYSLPFNIHAGSYSFPFLFFLHSLPFPQLFYSKYYKVNSMFTSAKRINLSV